MPGIEVLDRAHDEAVEQSHVAVCACSCLDPPTGQELEALQNVEESLLPFLAVGGFGLSECVRDTLPCCLNRGFHCISAVARLPNMTRDWRVQRLVTFHRGTWK